MEEQSLQDGFGLARSGRSLPIALLRAREAVMERFRPLLSQHDVTEQQWRVLRVLDELGRTDAGTLAAQACVLAPSLTRMLRSLDSRGFVAWERDTEDGRRIMVALTKPGRAFIHTVSPDSTQVYREIEERLGADRIASLLDDLEFVLDRLERAGE